MNDISKQDFLTLLETDKTFLIEIYGSTCGPCRMQAMILDKIQDDNKEIRNKVEFYKFCIDDNDDIAQKFNIMMLPTILVFKNKELVKTFIGMTNINVLTNFLTEI